MAVAGSTAGEVFSFYHLPAQVPVLPGPSAKHASTISRFRLLEVVGRARKALAADFCDVALFVRGLPVFIGLAGFQGNRLIADRTTRLSSLAMAKGFM